MSKYYGTGALYIDRDANIWKCQVVDYHSTPMAEPGILRRVFRPGWGDQLYRYVQNKSNSAFAKGDCVSFVAPVAITPSANTSLVEVVTTGLTINEYQYDIFYVTDNASGAGAAPEGEFSIITQNSATIISLDADLPMTAAVTSSDTCVIITYCHVVDSADGDAQVEFAGVAVSAIPDDYWGWVQCAGLCDYVTGTASNALADLAAAQMGVAVLIASSSDTLEKLVAAKRGASKSDTVATKWMAELKGNAAGFGGNQVVVSA